MSEPDPFGSVQVPLPLRHRLVGAWRALMGRDVLYGQGASIQTDLGRAILAKLPIAQWVYVSDVSEAHGILALKIEKVVGRVVWDDPRVAEYVERYRAGHDG